MRSALFWDITQRIVVNSFAEGEDRPQEHMYLQEEHMLMGTAVAQWLRCCATNRKVAGSIPHDVIGIFH